MSESGRAECPVLEVAGVRWCHGRGGSVVRIRAAASSASRRRITLT